MRADRGIGGALERVAGRSDSGPGGAYGGRERLRAVFRLLLKRLRVERIPHVSQEESRQARAPIRHANDAPVLAALKALPDWVLTDNTAHFAAEVSARTGLRIATPEEFLRQAGRLFGGPGAGGAIDDPDRTMRRLGDPIRSSPCCLDLAAQGPLARALAWLCGSCAIRPEIVRQHAPGNLALPIPMPLAQQRTAQEFVLEDGDSSFGLRAPVS